MAAAAHADAGPIKDAVVITFDMNDEVLLFTSTPKLFDLLVMQRVLADYVDAQIRESQT